MQEGHPDTAPDAGSIERHRGPGDHRWPGRRCLRAWLLDDRGSATAEYAVVILAAVAFAGVLVAVMRSGEVQAILTDLVRTALTP
jgi:Flp pilus assembly pilin Flp